MMNKSKIDWCDFTWNPVTGCPRGCAYCYARKQAGRFCGDIRLNKASEQITHAGDGTYILEKPFRNNKDTVTPFPVGFAPTFHKYRLPLPEQKKKPAVVFVCSMGDLFAPIIPTRWIAEVFDACAAAPWHTYLFLTKYPQRYQQLEHLALLPHAENMWYGTTITDLDDADRILKLPPTVHRFVSIEPIHGPIDLDCIAPPEPWPPVEWVIVGAETGNQKSKVTPERSWIAGLAGWAHRNGVPVLQKDSDEMRAVLGKEPCQEFPKQIPHIDIPIPHCSECEAHTAEFRNHDPIHNFTKYNHTCSAGGAPRKIRGRDARTSPSWCPKRNGEPICHASQSQDTEK